MPEGSDSSVHESDATTDIVSSTDPFSPDHVSRSRGRTAGLVVAVAAAALLIGSTGYALGARNGDAAITGTPEPAISGIVAGPGSVGSGVAVGRADLMVYPYGGYHIVFSASGLSDAAGQAKAWAYDASSAFSKATVLAAAKALGLSGDARLVDGSWVVGDTSGNGPSLQLTPDGLASLSFYDPRVTTGDCAIATPVPENGGPDSSTSSGAGSDGKPGECAPSDVTAMSSSDAINRTRALLVDLGVDGSAVASMTFDVSTDGAGGSYVTATRVVDGAPTGDSWSVSWVGDKLSSAYGAMAPLVSLGDYDVVSPVDAVNRLSDPRFGMMYGGIMPMAMDDTRGGAAWAPIPPSGTASVTGAGGDTAVSSSVVGPLKDDAAVKDPTPPTTVSPGDDISWPVQHVTITDAQLTLVSYTAANGAQFLLPAYQLSDGNNGSWTVLAVADNALDFDATTP